MLPVSLPGNNSLTLLILINQNVYFVLDIIYAKIMNYKSININLMCVTKQ